MTLRCFSHHTNSVLSRFCIKPVTLARVGMLVGTRGRGANGAQPSPGARSAACRPAHTPRWKAREQRAGAASLSLPTGRAPGPRPPRFPPRRDGGRGLAAAPAGAAARSSPQEGKPRPPSLAGQPGPAATQPGARPPGGLPTAAAGSRAAPPRPCAPAATCETGSRARRPANPAGPRDGATHRSGAAAAPAPAPHRCFPQQEAERAGGRRGGSMAGGRQLRSRRQSHAGQRGNRLWASPPRSAAAARPRGARPPPRPDEPGARPLPPSEAGARARGRRWAGTLGGFLVESVERGARPCRLEAAGSPAVGRDPLAPSGHISRSGDTSSTKVKHYRPGVV